jgi:hypothetical protein
MSWKNWFKQVEEVEAEVEEKTKQYFGIDELMKKDEASYKQGIRILNARKDAEIDYASRVSISATHLLANKPSYTVTRALEKAEEILKGSGITVDFLAERLYKERDW